MSKKKSTLPPGSLRHAAAYATAAGAAMAVTAPAQAAIHWSGPKDLVVNRDHTPVAVDLNGDGIGDFSFVHYGTVYSKYYGTNTTLFFTNQLMGLTGNTGNSAVGSTHYPVPYRLQQGDMVSQGMAGAWTYYGYLAAGVFYRIHTAGTYTYTTSYRVGNFINQEGFLGVRFQIDGNTHYGWIAFEGTWDPPGWSEGRIAGWAYEDVPGKSIAAGDQGPVIPPIPTLNEWGMIFLAALIVASGAHLLKNRREEI
ncbi:MAG: IPTL-CTERM sorting domain-containing protein [Deltaproteobacteria bacterium]|nr:IPTL-CTERM sorting domain-containing protein [Deltaproteobacteria bacterium]